MIKSFLRVFLLGLTLAACEGVTFPWDENPSISKNASGDLTAFDDAYQQGNYEEAIGLLEPLAKQGYANAQFNMGLMNDKGDGIAQNYEEAVRWYSMAAEQGLAEAQYNLSSMYAIGQGVEKNYALTEKWLLKAAEQGFVDAQEALKTINEGKALPSSEFPAENAVIDINQQRKQAELGGAEAQSAMATMYAKGKGGVTRDYDEALIWFRKAANQGNADAQANLGIFYFKGYGVKRNAIKAYMWLHLAALNGMENAGEARDSVAKIMKSDELSEAKALVKKWLSEH